MKNKQKNRGQAIIEFTLLLAAMTTVSFLLIRGLSSTIYPMWKAMSNKVAWPTKIP